MARVNGDELTVAILTEIRDEVRSTNVRVDRTNERLDVLSSLPDQVRLTNERLDRLAEGQIRIATEVAGLRGEVAGLRGEVVDLRGEVVDLRGEVGRLGGEVSTQGARLENAILTGGQMMVELRGRVERLEHHVGLEPA